MMQSIAYSLLPCTLALTVIPALRMRMSVSSTCVTFSTNARGASSFPLRLHQFTVLIALFYKKPNLYLANTRDPNALCIDASNCAVETSTHAPSLLMTSARVRERAPALKPRLLRLIRPFGDARISAQVRERVQVQVRAGERHLSIKFERSKGGDPQAPVSDSPVVRERRPITLNLSRTSLEA